ncbi:MAG: hypothetical protein ABI134_21445 [Byssovorax sp.]
MTRPLAPGLPDLSVEASSFLPTLERARSEGYVLLDPDGDEVALLPGEPVVQRRLAALVVRARVVRREVRDDLTEMSPGRAAGLLGEIPPVPLVFASQSYVVRLQVEGGPGVACTHCDVQRPGSTACLGCGGSGSTILGLACSACSDGFIACVECDGSGATVAVELRHIDDVELALRDVFVPEAFRYIPALFTVPGLLRDLLEDADPPMALAFPLVSRPQSSAYRDAVRRELEPEFHGHRFEDAMDTARRSLRAMLKPKTEAVLVDVRSFAWPFLWVELGKGEEKQEAVLVVRPDGRLGGYVSRSE